MQIVDIGPWQSRTQVRSCKGNIWTWENGHSRSGKTLGKSNGKQLNCEARWIHFSLGGSTKLIEIPR